MSELSIRPVGIQDSLADLTALLHRAYARLGAMNLNFTAVDQGVDVTADRVARGHCFIAEYRSSLAGTATVYRPDPEAYASPDRQSAWANRPDVASFGQLGVEPHLHGLGIGNALIACCEDWARRAGYAHLALDTAVPAEHLKRYYGGLGYVPKDEVQWRGKRYRTVIMVKTL